MTIGRTGPGDDVEAWCTKCRMNLNHRIIAVLGKAIQKVQCLTCGGDHKYYPPKNVKERAAEKVPKVQSEKAKKAAIAKSAEKSENEWAVFMREKPEDLIPENYGIREHYKVGQFLEHPTLGTGKVLDVVGAERIEVIFKSGRKILVANRK